MNRASKWYQTTRENRRPRRQCYQPLRADEDLENEIKEFEYQVDTDSTIQLSSIQPELYVERILEPGDTLQTLSLQFNCPVAELKRINHILRDNEIYARRKIKVPMKPGSIVTEKLAGVHTNGFRNEGYNECANVTSSTDEETENITITKSLSLASKQFPHKSLHLKDYSSCEEILNNQPGPSAIFTSASDESALLNVENNSVSSLQTDVPDGINSNSENIPFKCNGADWGLSWLQVVVCALLLGFFGPLFFYILYLTEKKHSS